MHMSPLNLDQIQSSPLKTNPYPYFTVPESVAPGTVADVIKGFPEIGDGGSYNVADLSIEGPLSELIDSFDSKEFRSAMGEKFGVNVDDSPLMVTLRGYSRKKDGRIHTDSKTKLLTILIYLNESWESETGKLRILNNGTDINDFVDEIDPGPGAMVGFKVTDNCWHGYVPFEGKRQSIQINFLASEAANKKHRFFHGLSAKLKKLKGKP